jgi:hypothetical protein
MLGVAQGALGGVLGGTLVVLASRFAASIPLVGQSLGGQTAYIAGCSLVAVGVLLGLIGSISAARTSLPRDSWERPSHMENIVC